MKVVEGMILGVLAVVTPAAVALTVCAIAVYLAGKQSRKLVEQWLKEALDKQEAQLGESESDRSDAGEGTQWDALFAYDGEKRKPLEEESEGDPQ